MNEKAAKNPVQSKMNAAADANMNDSEHSTEFLEFQSRVKDANINDQPLLATDYLNHFNEIVMILDMLPDMPELIDEAKS
jgi:hypothetical protein